MTRTHGSYRCRVKAPEGANHGEYRRRVRLLLADRDGERCFYCRRPADPFALTFDHFAPACLLPVSEPWNLVLACDPCNQAKRDRLPRGLVWVLLSCDVKAYIARQAAA